MFVQGKSYYIPFNIVFTVSLSLLAALLLNAVSTYVSVMASYEGLSKQISLSVTDKETYQGMASKGAPSVLPVDVRRAALTVAPADGYGVFDDSAWNSIIPPGHGFVHVQEEYYAVSLYHQIHCVNSFRKIFISKMKPNSSIDEMLPHVEHCLSYLRQMVLCHGDTTLEPSHPASSVAGGSTQAVYGEGVTHNCQDWSQIRSYVEENYLEWQDQDKWVTTEGNQHKHHNHVHHHQEDESEGGEGHHHGA